jgi:hypothetical protein
MSTHSAPWSFVPESARIGARQAYARPSSAPGLGDGFTYHWQVEDPPASYVGPLPFCRYLRRTRSASRAYF